MSPSASTFPDVYRGDKGAAERGRKGLPGFISRFTSSSSAIPPTSPIVNAPRRKSAEFLQLPTLPSDVLSNGTDTSPTSAATDATPGSEAGTSMVVDEHVVDEKGVRKTLLSTEDSLKLVKATSVLIKERG